MLFSPFLLSVVLAAWSIRLSIAFQRSSVRTRSGERTVAYSLSLASLSMTLLAMAYMLSHGLEFWLAEMAGIGTMALGASAVWALRGKVPGYPAPLIVMTTAWVSNALMTLCVLPVHHAWNSAGTAGLLIVSCQTGATIVAVIVWCLYA